MNFNLELGEGIRMKDLINKIKNIIPAFIAVVYPRIQFYL